MPTDRLFDADPYRLEFEARLVDLRPEEKMAALDATAFFPEDGGQKSDQGSLGGIPVVGLSVDPDGTIWHRLETAPRWEIGTLVQGRVDAAVRRDHRQQHSGQHILSRVFTGLLGARTLSFHMGEVSSTIDLPIDPPTDEVLASVEEAANAVVLDDLPVAVTAEPREGLLPLRTVHIEGLESQHCCGTHVRRTGEVGPIKILRTEKAKGALRVHFVCGERALRLFRGLAAGADRMARLLSAGWLDLPDLVSGALDRAREMERQLRLLRKRHLFLQAERLARESARLDDGTLWVASWMEGADAEGLREAANEILGQGRALVVLAGSGEPNRAVWVAARTDDLPEKRRVDAGRFLQEVLAPLQGRGGGTLLFAQGSCGADEAACKGRLAALASPIARP
ncbi:MAG: hypothetical protein FJY88_05940 [Candidatus Eisenbacteria bacterium]|nr:hypothetical protein [Candidatus Eisenbacteria bacterium]